jgi:Arc/MetJ family transcription regulator
MRNKNSSRKRKHFVLDEAKLKRTQECLGAKTESETIEMALDAVIVADAHGRAAWGAHEGFIKSEAEIRDVFGKLRSR